MEKHPFEGSYRTSCVRPGCYAKPDAEVHHYVPEGWCQWDQEEHDYPTEGECRRCGAEQPTGELCEGCGCVFDKDELDLRGYCDDCAAYQREQENDTEEDEN